MPKALEIVVVGYATKDINICGDERSENTGGAAYFVSLAASLFTDSVGLIARVGKDFKDSLITSRKLKSGLIYDSVHKTATSTQIYDNPNDLTSRKIILEQGASEFLLPTDLSNEILKAAKIIHIATMPPSHQSQFVEYLRERAKENSYLISIDTDVIFLQSENSIQRVVKNLRACDIVFLNRREYQKLKKHLTGHKNLIIKEDMDGAYWEKEGRVIQKVEAPIVKVTDVTGAGDIFAGVFLANYLKNQGKSLEEAVRLATLSTTQKGINHLFIQK